MPACCKNKSDDAISLTDKLPMIDISHLPKEPSVLAILNF